MTGSIISSGLSAVTGFFGGIQTYLIVGAVSGLVAASGAAYVTYRVEQSTINAMKLSDQKAATKAVTLAAASVKRQDAVILNSAITEAKAQAQIVTRTVTLTKEIEHDVPTTVACIPVGFVRLLNGAAANSGTADQSFAPGQSDDACAPVSWRSLAADLADDYGIGNANAEQLNALEAEVRKQASVEQTK